MQQHQLCFFAAKYSQSNAVRTSANRCLPACLFSGVALGERQNTSLVERRNLLRGRTPYPLAATDQTRFIQQELRDYNPLESICTSRTTQPCRVIGSNNVVRHKSRFLGRCGRKIHKRFMGKHHGSLGLVKEAAQPLKLLLAMQTRRLNYGEYSRRFCGVNHDFFHDDFSLSLFRWRNSGQSAQALFRCPLIFALAS